MRRRGFVDSVSSQGYRDRLADECRRLAQWTHKENPAVAGFARLTGRTEGWRQVPKPDDAGS
jgi:hypothetical protein